MRRRTRPLQKGPFVGSVPEGVGAVGTGPANREGGVEGGF